MTRHLLIACTLTALGSSPAAAAPSPLADAAMRGDAAEVRALLGRAVAVNAPQGDGSTALHWAAHRGDAEMVSLLLQHGADVRATTRLGGLTPLMMAATNGDAPVVSKLLEARSDANAANANGTTALMLASAAGQVEPVTLLLAKGAKVDAKEATHGQTALMFAAGRGRADVIRVLAAHGADLDAQTVVSPIVLLGERYKKQTDGKGTRSITSEGGRSDVKAMGGMTALMFAAREGSLESVRALADAGANLDVQNGSDGMSVLTLAIVNGRFDVAALLLERGADPNRPSKTGLAPLYATIDAQWPERTWYPPASVSEEQTTHVDLLSALLARGADPNARLGLKPWYRTFHGDWVDPEGATPFWLAAKANDVEAMKVLVAGGANPSVPTKRGVTPLQVAAGYGFEPQVTNFQPGARLAAIRYLVEELGADVNARDAQGYTALHGAGLTANRDVILYLVAMGGDVTARARNVFGGDGEDDKGVKDETGDTVADMANGPRAHNMQFPETVALLENLGSKNSQNCRYATCVVKTLPSAPKATK